MRRDPAITFRGALQILGHHDRPWLDRLNRLLGGAVLAAGLAPAAAAFSAVWGWVDQKNEAAGLLRNALDSVSGRLTRTGGLARHELVVAAHTTIVLAAFFDTLREEMRDLYDEAEITDAEKVLLAGGETPRWGEETARQLYGLTVPCPSTLGGFEETATGVTHWAKQMVREVRGFLAELNLTRRVEPSPDGFERLVTSRYRSYYLELAATVPEFALWASFAEHAATRTAFARLADLLTLSTADTPARDPRRTVWEVNQAELARPVIDIDADGYGIDAVFPAVADIFLTPHFRAVETFGTARLADERWWDDVEFGSDLELLLARHFSTPGSTRLPLLLLGHPGAGKSLLTKVLAARLPESAYTVVRVPLRRVEANTTVSDQIQQALDLATNRRVSWPDLVDQSAETIRVVLLDGLDELLQATTHDRGGYLNEIVEFQRVEAALGRPVAVVVTSRTLVADRVRLPYGLPVVKLEEFDDDQIRQWIAVWNAANTSSPARRMPPEAALAQRELAGQPLLLMMLTLYYSDPQVALSDKDLSQADLYERLFDTFARREVTKKAGQPLAEAEMAVAVDDQLRRLSTAAMGMFNRGKHAITEAELSADLAGLGEPSPSGQRLLGEFFFVHSAEANTGTVQRSYEFLHATFAEYLAAARVVDVLAEVAEGAFGRRRFHEPDDELLFVLLSHQTLAIQRPTLGFIGARLAAMDADERADIARTLDLLIADHRHRRPASRYPDYRPQAADTVRALAAYSANLVLLRVAADVDRAGVPLANLWPEGDAMEQWRSMVSLWQAGLDAEGYRAMLPSISCREGVLTAAVDSGFLAGFDDIRQARLREERDLERRLRTGYALHDGLTYAVHEGQRRETDNWVDYIVSWLWAAAMRGPGETPMFADLDAPESVPLKVTADVADLAYAVLGMRCRDWTADFTMDFLRWLMRLRSPRNRSPLPLLLALRTHPTLLRDLHDMAESETWTPEWRMLLRAVDGRHYDERAVSDYLDAISPPALATLSQPIGPWHIVWDRAALPVSAPWFPLREGTSHP
ncbi:NACHT domain-containing protein [Actinokineospora iranica]|uniref:AAA domain (Dynein-related subfamily) n=1 Tax=Actinokineospora iranica TaxID=1271860 RepID=A0A1G6JDP2_9PSEU|nr:AAA family ATPase [Actinokineospora iranica]SDC16820.1 AAA domain (dynein-related subfamily) [Actinokineospora iranica]